MARNLELDLVEISPKASPPVCKILEYKKFLYEQKKRDKALKSKTSKIVVKEFLKLFMVSLYFSASGKCSKS